MTYGEYKKSLSTPWDSDNRPLVCPIKAENIGYTSIPIPLRKITALGILQSAATLTLLLHTVPTGPGGVVGYGGIDTFWSQGPHVNSILTSVMQLPCSVNREWPATKCLLFPSYCSISIHFKVQPYFSFYGRLKKLFFLIILSSLQVTSTEIPCPHPSAALYSRVSIAPPCAC